MICHLNIHTTNLTPELNYCINSRPGSRRLPECLCSWRGGRETQARGGKLLPPSLPNHPQHLIISGHNGELQRVKGVWWGSEGCGGTGVRGVYVGRVQGVSGGCYGGAAARPTTAQGSRVALTSPVWPPWLRIKWGNILRCVPTSGSNR